VQVFPFIKLFKFFIKRLAQNMRLKNISNSDQYVILHSKMDEKNPTYASLTQENGFGSA
jgi:hypothetical protein